MVDYRLPFHTLNSRAAAPTHELAETHDTVSYPPPETLCTDHRDRFRTQARPWTGQATGPPAHSAQNPTAVHALIDEHDTSEILRKPNDGGFRRRTRRRDQREPFQRSATAKPLGLIPTATQPVLDGHDTTSAPPDAR
jgi:hypothetical protein